MPPDDALEQAARAYYLRCKPRYSARINTDFQVEQPPTLLTWETEDEETRELVRDRVRKHGVN